MPGQSISISDLAHPAHGCQNSPLSLSVPPCIQTGRVHWQSQHAQRVLCSEGNVRPHHHGRHFGVWLTACHENSHISCRRSKAALSWLLQMVQCTLIMVQNSFSKEGMWVGLLWPAGFSSIKNKPPPPDPCLWKAQNRLRIAISL